MKKYIRFYLMLSPGFLLPLVAIGWLNITVDPYDIFNSPKIQKFNNVKPVKPNHERLIKAIDITDLKPITLLLGTSRSRSALNPTHPVFDKYQPAYNVGLPSANMYELKRYFEHALANQPNVKLVVLEIDSFAFNVHQINTPDFSENRLEQKSITMQDVVNTTISMDAFIASANTVIHNVSKIGESTRYINGMLDSEVNKKPSSVSKFTQYLMKWRYKLASNYLKDFEYIIKECQQRGIDIKIYISPSHATFWENIRRDGYWEDYKNWKRQIVKIAPVWDFSGYNSITTEKYSDKLVMKNYTDSSHYNIAVGNLVLKRLFQYQEETVPSDFGVMLTPDNIEDSLAKIDADREAWAKNNPDAVKFVKNLKRRNPT